MNSRAQPEPVRDDTELKGTNAAGTARALEPKASKYLPFARAAAEFSKDPSTKVGALIVGPAGETRGTGYNGAPRGCLADEDERITQRPEKYFWIEHAERNAIYNAARCGTPTEGCSMVITHAPCMDCARAIVQAGIKLVMWPVMTDGEHIGRWIEHADRVLHLFAECGVKVRIV